MIIDKYTFCTLFDKNYLDKGMVMLDSLLKVCKKQPIIYVLCMDEFTEMVLKDYYPTNVFLISLEDFLDLDLRKLKETRSRGEFCWTCTAKLINYIFEKYESPVCTYVDSDLCFYSDPSCLIDEMLNCKCDAQVIPHWFTNSYQDNEKKNESGEFCVQFNTFLNTSKARKLLSKWISECFNECSYSSGGDQKYLEEWKKLDFVNITTNRGAGIAPWNIQQYKLMDKCLTVKHKLNKRVYKIIFYHFQSMIYVNRNTVYVDPYIQHSRIDGRLFKYLYQDYLFRTEKLKKFIENKYDYLPLIVKYKTNGDNGRPFSLKHMRTYINMPIKEIIYRGIMMFRRKFKKHKIYIKIKEGNDDTLQ